MAEAIRFDILESIINRPRSSSPSPSALGGQYAAQVREHSIHSSASSDSYDTVPDDLPADTRRSWLGPPEPPGRPISRRSRRSSDGDQIENPVGNTFHNTLPDNARSPWPVTQLEAPGWTISERDRHTAGDPVQNSSGNAVHAIAPNNAPSIVRGSWSGPLGGLGRKLGRPISGRTAEDATQNPGSRAPRGTAPVEPPTSAHSSQIGSAGMPSRPSGLVSQPLADSIRTPSTDFHGWWTGPPRRETNKENQEKLQSVIVPGRDQEARLGAGERDVAGRAAMYLEYLREAAHEDKQLEGRWTETLNILLIFGGLLSATITAFLIAVQPDLNPAPSDATNKILLQILQRLDNSTLIPTDSEDASPSSTTVRVLAWWYTSLACSLTSTFGALLSKQWVLHYASRPSFADTLEKQCELREVRHQGLTKWHFNAIIEVLPVLLQVALLLFAIGLAEYLQPTPLLCIITLAFISALGSFYLVTLLAGVFLPACPFKTPVTHIMFRAVGLIATWSAAIYLLLITLGACLPIPFGRERKPISEVFKLTRDVARNTVAYFTNGAMRARWHIEYGEQSLLGKNSAGSAGVLGAQLQRHVGEERPKIEGLEVAAEEIMKMPIKIGANTFRQRPTFDLWSGQVIWQLGRPTPLPRGWLVEADLLFHIIYHFPESISSAKMGVLHDHELNIFTEKDSMGRLAMIVRRGWGRGDKSLPIATMSPTTIAAYLNFQLSHWCHQAPQERCDRELIIRELPDLLTSQGLRDAHLHIAIINAVSLTAMFMVKDDGAGSLPWGDFLECDPLERLFRALDRLSFYPADQRPSRFLPLAVEASYQLLLDDNLRSKCAENQSWRGHEFAQTLLRLLRLGRSWWHREPARWSVGAPGANLVHQVRKVLHLFAKDCVDKKDPSPPGFSECGLEEAFTFFAHPSAHSIIPPDVSISALQLLDYAFGLHETPRARLGWLRPRKPTNPQSDDHPLAKCPEVLYQLLSIIEELPEDLDSQRKKMVLSIMVKGREVFFPKSHKRLSPGTAQLSQDLIALASYVQRPGYASGPLDAADPVIVTRTWDALTPALCHILSVLPTPEESQGNIEYTIEGNIPRTSASMHPLGMRPAEPAPTRSTPARPKRATSRHRPSRYVPDPYAPNPYTSTRFEPRRSEPTRPEPTQPAPPRRASTRPEPKRPAPVRFLLPPAPLPKPTYQYGRTPVPDHYYGPPAPAPNYSTLQFGIRSGIRHIREELESPPVPPPPPAFIPTRSSRYYSD